MVYIAFGSFTFYPDITKSLNKYDKQQSDKLQNIKYMENYIE